MLGMQKPAGILFQMYACDTHAVEHTARYYWIFVLRDLVAFGEIRIKIIFAVKVALCGNLPAKRKTNPHHTEYRITIDYRQSPRMPHTHWANVDIQMLFERVVEAPAKHLGTGIEFGMHFEAYYRLVFFGNLLFS